MKKIESVMARLEQCGLDDELVKDTVELLKEYREIRNGYIRKNCGTCVHCVEVENSGVYQCELDECRWLPIPEEVLAEADVI